MALGASRLRLLQLQFSEPLLLAAAGGTLGVGLARLALGAVPSVVAERVPGLHEVSIDLRVLAFTAAVSLVTALLVALVPALTAERREPSEALQESAARTTGHQRHRMQGALVVLTVALSFVLLVSAGLFLRSFAALLASDRGFRPAGVLTASVSLPWTVYPTADRVYAFHEALLRRIAALPWRTESGALQRPAARGQALLRLQSGGFGVDGVIPPARRSSVYGSYFETLGLSLRRGRLFTQDEYDTDRRVVIVNEKLADRYWPGADPVGKRLKWGAAGNANPWLTIVGVVNDAVDGRDAVTTMDDERPVHVYEPFRQTPAFVVNARGSMLDASCGCRCAPPPTRQGSPRPSGRSSRNWIASWRSPTWRPWRPCQGHDGTAAVQHGRHHRFCRRRAPPRVDRTVRTARVRGVRARRAKSASSRSWRRAAAGATPDGEPRSATGGCRNRPWVRRRAGRDAMAVVAVVRDAKRRPDDLSRGPGGVARGRGRRVPDPGPPGVDASLRS